MRGRLLIAFALVGAFAGCQESGFDESRETQRPLKVQHAMDMLTGTKVPGVAERPLTLTADSLGDALALDVEPVRAALPGGRLPEYLREEARGVEVVAPLDRARPRRDRCRRAGPDPRLQGGERRALRGPEPDRSDGHDRGRQLEAQPAAARRGARAHERRRAAPDRVGRSRGEGEERDRSCRPHDRGGGAGPTSFAKHVLADLDLEAGRGGDIPPPRRAPIGPAAGFWRPARLLEDIAAAALRSSRFGPLE